MTINPQLIAPIIKGFFSIAGEIIKKYKQNPDMVDTCQEGKLPLPPIFCR